MITRKVSVLGSTGSVGTSTLDLMDQAEAAGSGAFQVEVLTEPVEPRTLTFRVIMRPAPA